MKYPAFALALLALAACDAPTSGLPLGAEAVPFAQLLEETADRPFECAAYDPATDTCEGTATNRAVGDTFVSEARALVSQSPRIEVRSRAALTTIEDRACVNAADLEWDVRGDGLSAFNQERIAVMMANEMATLGVICVRYLRAGSSYIQQTTDANGRQIADFDDTVVTFFARRPALRTITFDGG